MRVPELVRLMETLLTSPKKRSHSANELRDPPITSPKSPTLKSLLFGKKTRHETDDRQDTESSISMSLSSPDILQRFSEVERHRLDDSSHIPPLEADANELSSTPMVTGYLETTQDIPSLDELMQDINSQTVEDDRPVILVPSETVENKETVVVMPPTEASPAPSFDAKSELRVNTTPFSTTATSPTGSTTLVPMTPSLLIPGEASLSPPSDQEEQDLITQMLNLRLPKLEPAIIDYLLLPGGIEKLVGRITRLDPADTEYISCSSDDRPFLERVILLPRVYNITPAEEKTMLYSYRVTELLCSFPPVHRVFVKENLERILFCLIRVLEPHSAGNLKHFAKIIASFHTRFDNLADLLMERTDPLINQPYIITFLRYILHPDVIDCLPNLLLRNSGDYDVFSVHIPKQRFSRLLEIGFIDTLFGLILQQELPSVVVGACEFLSRLLEKTRLIDGSQVMYLGLGGKHGALQRLFMLMVDEKNPLDLRFEWIRLFHQILVTKFVSGPVNDTVTGTGGSVRTDIAFAALDVSIRRMSVLCGKTMLQSRTLPTSSLISILEIVHAVFVADFVNASPVMFDNIATEIPWSYLVDLYFNRFKTVSVYHAIFYKFLHHAVHTDHQSALEVLVLPSFADEALTIPRNSLFDEIVQQYPFSGETKGIHGLILNLFRLSQISHPDSIVNEALQTNPTWQDYVLPMLLEDTKASIRPVGQFPDSMPRPFPYTTPLIAMGVGAIGGGEFGGGGAKSPSTELPNAVAPVRSSSSGPITVQRDLLEDTFVPTQTSTKSLEGAAPEMDTTLLRPRQPSVAEIKLVNHASVSTVKFKSVATLSNSTNSSRKPSLNESMTEEHSVLESSINKTSLSLEPVRKLKYVATGAFSSAIQERSTIHVRYTQNRALSVITTKAVEEKQEVQDPYLLSPVQTSKDLLEFKKEWGTSSPVAVTLMVPIPHETQETSALPKNDKESDATTSDGWSLRPSSTTTNVRFLADDQDELISRKTGEDGDVEEEGEDESTPWTSIGIGSYYAASLGFCSVLHDSISRASSFVPATSIAPHDTHDPDGS